MKDDKKKPLKENLRWGVKPTLKMNPVVTAFTILREQLRKKGKRLYG